MALNLRSLGICKRHPFGPPDLIIAHRFRSPRLAQIARRARLLNIHHCDHKIHYAGRRRPLVRLGKSGPQKRLAKLGSSKSSPGQKQKLASRFRFQPVQGFRVQATTVLLPTASAFEHRQAEAKSGEHLVNDSLLKLAAQRHLPSAPISTFDSGAASCHGCLFHTWGTMP